MAASVVITGAFSYTGKYATRLLLSPGIGWHYLDAKTLHHGGHRGHRGILESV